MANLHQVEIVGTVPFNLYEDEKVCHILGILNAPSLGVRIKWGSHTFVSNENGGKTAMYKFRIEGREALRTSFIREIAAEFVRVGAILEVAHCADLEEGNDHSWIEVN